MSSTITVSQLNMSCTVAAAKARLNSSLFDTCKNRREGVVAQEQKEVSFLFGTPAKREERVL
jgi:hypothetical protein